MVTARSAEGQHRTVRLGRQPGRRRGRRRDGRPRRRPCEAAGPAATDAQCSGDRESRRDLPTCSLSVPTRSSSGRLSRLDGRCPRSPGSGPDRRRGRCPRRPGRVPSGALERRASRMRCSCSPRVRTLSMRSVRSGGRGGRPRQGRRAVERTANDHRRTLCLTRARPRPSLTLPGASLRGLSLGRTCTFRTACTAGNGRRRSA